MKYFGRVYKLELGDGQDIITYDGFPDGEDKHPAQIEFSIDQTPAAERSYSEITVTGVRKERRKSIYERFSKARLTAGWREGFGVIFNGAIENVELGRDGPNTFIKLFCQSAASEWPTAVINRAFGKGTPYVNIIRTVASTFGVPVEFVGDFNSLPKAVNGLTLSRSSRQALLELAETFEFEFLLENGRLIIVKDGASRQDRGMSEYSAVTGLIGSPELTMRGVNIDVLMDPYVRPKDEFKLNAVTGQLNFNGIYYQSFPDINGIGSYQANAIVHKGDFYGDTWQTSIEGLRRRAI